MEIVMIPIFILFAALGIGTFLVASIGALVGIWIENLRDDRKNKKDKHA